MKQLVYGTEACLKDPTRAYSFRIDDPEHKRLSWVSEASVVVIDRAERIGYACCV